MKQPQHGEHVEGVIAVVVDSMAGQAVKSGDCGCLAGKLYPFNQPI